MQERFDFGSGDIAGWRAALSPLLPADRSGVRRKPVGQLIKSMISGRTKDAVSLAAYQHLRDAFGDAAGIAASTPGAVEAVIADVTFAGMKAQWLVEALRQIQAERPDFDLTFLAGLPLAKALAWLERLPGVGRKVAASTLNASALSLPVFIVDSHVLRILQRLQFVGLHADMRLASETVTAAMPRWNGDDFLDFHIVMKRLGQAVCHFDAPDCAACPLAGSCPHGD